MISRSSLQRNSSFPGEVHRLIKLAKRTEIQQEISYRSNYQEKVRLRKSTPVSDRKAQGGPQHV